MASLLEVPLKPHHCQEEVDDGEGDPAALRLEPASLDASSPPEVLYHGHGLFIIDKPPDVRMSGDFAVTVERLIRHWHKDIAPASLGLKWIHQLDYATSGVLCIGLSRPAAAAASALFEGRLCKKEYVALVLGHVDPSRFPTNPDESIHDADGSFEGIRKIKRPGLRVQYKPASAFFQDYKNTLLKASRALEPWEEVVATRRWAQAKLVEEVRQRFEREAETDKARAMAQNEEATRRERAGKQQGPAMAAAGGVYRRRDEEPECFVVDIPITELKDDFRVHLGEGPQARRARTIVRVEARGVLVHPPNSSRDGQHPPNSSRDGQHPPNSSRDGQQPPPEQAVTKVRLSPVTGRRHQLRVHLAHVGHPIVGDVTYANRPGDRAIEAPRMMLHARSLTLPFGQGRRYGPYERGPGGILRVETRDPFLAYMTVHEDDGA